MAFLSRCLFALTSEQQPLRLNPAEVCEVIAAVCSETSSVDANVMTVSTRLNSHSGKPSMDVAVSVLVKLIIDMYVLIPLGGNISSFIFCLTLSSSHLITHMLRYFCVHTSAHTHKHLNLKVFISLCTKADWDTRLKYLACICKFRYMCISIFSTTLNSGFNWER